MIKIKSTSFVDKTIKKEKSAMKVYYKYPLEIQR